MKLYKKQSLFFSWKRIISSICKLYKTTYLCLKIFFLLLYSHVSNIDYTRI